MIKNEFGQQLAGHGDVLAFLSALEAGQREFDEAGTEVLCHLSSQFGEEPELSPQLRLEPIRHGEPGFEIRLDNRFFAECPAVPGEYNEFGMDANIKAYASRYIISTSMWADLQAPVGHLDSGEHDLRTTHREATTLTGALQTLREEVDALCASVFETPGVLNL
ncbi:hypothetical protein ACH4OW_29360 [Streptomyces sp. NPDC017056]|uniref:hypothetical protein n=1 Tax=Streptomyces sp. NPDC017056 TaxID=3364973 RepID=UPI0037AB65B2